MRKIHQYVILASLLMFAQNTTQASPIMVSNDLKETKRRVEANLESFFRSNPEAMLKLIEIDNIPGALVSPYNQSQVLPLVTMIKRGNSSLAIAYRNNKTDLLRDANALEQVIKEGTLELHNTYKRIYRIAQVVFAYHAMMKQYHNRTNDAQAIAIKPSASTPRLK